MNKLFFVGFSRSYGLSGFSVSILECIQHKSRDRLGHCHDQVTSYKIENSQDRQHLATQNKNNRIHERGISKIIVRMQFYDQWKARNSGPGFILKTYLRKFSTTCLFKLLKHFVQFILILCKVFSVNFDLVLMFHGPFFNWWWFNFLVQQSWTMTHGPRVIQYESYSTRYLNQYSTLK